MKNIKYILLLIAMGAYLNACMDYFGFKELDYGWQWHTLKIIMQGCYAFAIALAWDLKSVKSWILFLFAFAFLTWVFHDIPYHLIFN